MRGWLGTLTALPMSWHSDGDDHLVVGAGALGERRGLQRVRELVDREAVGDVGEAAQHAEHRLGDPAAGCAKVSLPITAHCSAVDSSMRVKVMVERCRVMPSILPHVSDERGDVAGGGDRRRRQPPPHHARGRARVERQRARDAGRWRAPVLWAFGGGAGLVLGAVVASWISRRAWPGIFAAVVGAVPYLVLVVVGYNSSDLRAEDQIVGSLLIVVLPGLLVA